MHWYLLNLENMFHLSSSCLGWVNLVLSPGLLPHLSSPQPADSPRAKPDNLLCQIAQRALCSHYSCLQFSFQQSPIEAYPTQSLHHLQGCTATQTPGLSFYLCQCMLTEFFLTLFSITFFCCLGNRHIITYFSFWGMTGLQGIYNDQLTPSLNMQIVYTIYRNKLWFQTVSPSTHGIFNMNFFTVSRM